MQSKHPDDIEKNRKLLAPNDVALCLITLLDRNNEELAKAVEALDRDLALKILREALYLRIFELIMEQALPWGGANSVWQSLTHS